AEFVGIGLPLLIPLNPLNSRRVRSSSVVGRRPIPSHTPETITELRGIFRSPFSLQLDRRGEAGRGSRVEPTPGHRWDAPRSAGIGSQTRGAPSIAPSGWRLGYGSRFVQKHGVWEQAQKVRRNDFKTKVKEILAALQLFVTGSFAGLEYVW